MLFEPNQTPYDLRFRLFGVPVRVHPLFWLVSAILGWGFSRLGLQFLLLWIACVFVSILVHEMGHVVAGRAFGTSGRIVLYSFGGLAVGSNALGRWWQRVIVSFAGPAAQLICLWLPLYLWGGRWVDSLDNASLGGQAKEMLIRALDMLFVINLYWAVLNLFPIWPLDGGQITREVLRWLMPARGVYLSLGISFLTAGVIAVNSLLEEMTHRPLIPWLYAGGWWMALFFGMFALNNYQEMQQGRRGPWDGPPPWERDPDFWKR